MFCCEVSSQPACDSISCHAGYSLLTVWIIFPENKDAVPFLGFEWLALYFFNQERKLDSLEGFQGSIEMNEVLLFVLIIWYSC